MERKEIHTLPPLVYGKLVGTLEIIIDNVEIIEKAIIKHTNCNFAVQILWWGETSSLLVRPNRIQFVREGNQPISLYEQGGSSLKYEIRTKLKLFKSYVTMCEVLELTLLDTTHNRVIGSAFVKDLIHLIFHTEASSCCVINDLGDHIGEITCRFVFDEVNSSRLITKDMENSWVSVKENVVSDYLNGNNQKINLNLSELYSPKEKNSSENEYEISENIKPHKNSLSSGTSNQIYSLEALESQQNLMTSQRPNSKQKIDCSSSLKRQEHEGLGCRKTLNRFTNTSLSPKDPKFLNTSEFLGNQTNRKIGDTTSFVKALPEAIDTGNGLLTVICLDDKDTKKVIQVSKMKKSNVQNRDLSCKGSMSKGKDQIWRCFKHPAKATSKNVSTNKMKVRTEKKLQKIKTAPIDRTTTIKQSKKVKPPSITNSENLNYLTKSQVKTNNNLKTFEKISSEISKLNKTILSPKKSLRDNDADLEKIPVRENRKDCPRDQTDMEPSVNRVNITKTFPERLCEQHQISNKNIFNDNVLLLQRNGSTLVDVQGNPPGGSKIIEKVNVTNKLFFDLSIPIERIYYETFFLKEQPFVNNIFEEIEMPNQTQSKSYKNLDEKKSHVTESKNENIRDGSTLSCLSESRNEVAQDHSNSFEDESDILSKISEEKDSLELKAEAEFFNRDRVNGREYTTCETEKLKSELKAQVVETKCHCCKYFKKLSELDKIIEALKNFETSLKKQAMEDIEPIAAGDLSVSINVENDNLNEKTHKLSHLNDNVNDNFDGREEIRHPEDFISDIGNNESDYSKEDSDFIEFTRYLSKR